ncbi:MAG TPA: 2-hydroxychromene-2-carboxylate isomerase [Myxococcota bacterium]|nr:2-hydroxychromene-2-carboxylate isomerase [Myxococcota bacterium]
MARLEFFFDCGSPWTYLAFHRIESLAAETGAELVWRPILVGGVFNAANGSVYEQRERPVPAKMRYFAKDLQDWARLYGITIRWPDVFPVNSVRAMRGAFVALDAGKLPAYARAVFEAYWGRGEDIGQEAVLWEIAAEVGLDPTEFCARIASPAVKERLRSDTDELVRRGGFGSPTMFVDGSDMYFGNDRLPLVREALRRARASEGERG